MSARDTIANLWSRAIPVGPLLNSLESEVESRTVRRCVTELAAAGFAQAAGYLAGGATSSREDTADG